MGTTTISPPGRRAGRALHPTLAVGIVAFLAFGGVLFARNHELFSHAIREDGDFAANSILVDDARHLTLLHGHYSRFKFHHPGPALLTVQAAGEIAFDDVLGVVPAPFNGQNLAVLLLNAALLAVALALIRDVSGSNLVTLLGGVTLFALLASHNQVLANPWPPTVFVTLFALLVLAAGSVAGGTARHLPALGLAMGFLVHGHVSFVFFVTLITVPALAALLWSREGSLADRVRSDLVHWRRFGIVLGLFALPIVANVVLHYPGEIGNYIDYLRSGETHHHTIGEALRFVASFWGDSRAGHVVGAIGFAIAAALAFAQPDPRLRRQLVGILAVCGLATFGMIFFAARGIDSLDERYLGWFYWGVPAATAVVLVVGAASVVRRGRNAGVLAVGATLSAAAALVVGLVSAQSPDLVTSYWGQPALVSVAATMAGARPNPQAPLVLRIDHDTWPDMVGLLVESDRHGVRACVDDHFWDFIVTAHFVCSQHDRDTGTVFSLHVRYGSAPPVPGAVPFATLNSSWITKD
jgi:hypothetical protein